MKADVVVDELECVLEGVIEDWQQGLEASV